MPTAYSTQGNTVSVDIETSLGVGTGSPIEHRIEEAIVHPTASRQLEPQANLGHALAAKRSDKPIPYERYRESELTLAHKIRRGASTNVPPMITILESGGWKVTSTADTTVATYTGVDDFDSTDSIVAGDAYGVPILVELSNGTYYPTLLAKYDDAPDKTCTPAMDLPSATEAGKAIKRMFSATIDPSEIGGTKTLKIEASTRGQHTTAPDLTWAMSGTALASIDPIEIAGDGSVVITTQHHVTDMEVFASTFAAESFQSGTTTTAETSYPVVRQDSQLFRFEMAAFDPAGGITATDACLLKATITPGVTAEYVPGVGSASCVNGAQSFMQRIADEGAAQIELELLFDIDYWNDAGKGMQDLTANQDTYIGFVWQTDTLDRTAAGIWAPRCYQLEPAEADPYGENYIKCMVKYVADTAEWTGETFGNSNTGNSPIIIGIHGQES